MPSNIKQKALDLIPVNTFRALDVEEQSKAERLHISITEASSCPANTLQVLHVEVLILDPAALFCCIRDCQSVVTKMSGLQSGQQAAAAAQKIPERACLLLPPDVHP